FFLTKVFQSTACTVMCGIGKVLWDDVRLIGSDVEVDETSLIAAGNRMEKIYEIPAILFRKFVAPCRHTKLQDSVRQPMEKVARGMHRSMRLREQINRFLRKCLGQHTIALGLRSMTRHAVCGE